MKLINMILSILAAVVVGAVGLDTTLVTVPGTSTVPYGNPGTNAPTVTAANGADIATPVMLDDGSVWPIPIPSNDPIYCNIPNRPSWASVSTIEDGIQYLRDLPDDDGHPRLCNAGPVDSRGFFGQCSRVSCSWNSGIYVCDDLSVEVKPTCKEVADYAADIVKYCSTLNYHTQGQKFGPPGSGWNVIVAGASC